MMDASFDHTWSALTTRLHPETVIRNWTAFRGYLGDTMRIVDVTDVEIVVQAPKAKNLQHVSREEFEKIWKHWPGYKSNRIQRQELREMTHYSKYIISILHWLEETQK